MARVRHIRNGKALPSGHKKRCKNAKTKDKIVLEKTCVYDCDRQNPCCQKRPQEAAAQEIRACEQRRFQTAVSERQHGAAGENPGPIWLEINKGV